MTLSRNEIVSVDIEILPSSTMFRAVESLQLTIQGRDLFQHPMLMHERTVNKGDHRIYAGDQYDSYLLIPVIPQAYRRDRSVQVKTGSDQSKI